MTRPATDPLTTLERLAEPWRPVRVEELSAYVSEAENLENVKNVRAVEVFAPSPLLSSGLCLVDTPGIGSVFEATTEATRSFVPHVDAALVVIGADPPISGDELRLVETVAREVREFLVVLAKADRLHADEVEQARSFSERVLERAVPGARVLVVSALEARERGATRDWPHLAQALETLARRRAPELLLAAERRAIGRVAGALDREIAEQRAALVRPREESERRLAALRAAVKEAERLLANAGPLFGAIERRLAEALEAARASFLSSARTSAEQALAEAIESDQGHPNAQARAIETAQRIAREAVESWRTQSAPEAEGAYANAVAELVEAATAVLRRIAGSGDPALAALPAGIEIDTRFRAPPHFYFTEMLTLSGWSLRTALSTLFGGAEGRRKALLARARPYLLRLLETNSARVENDFIDQIRESRRQLEADVRRLLRSATASVERAVENAEAARAGGEQGTADALARLDAIASQLRTLTGESRAG